LYLDEFAHVPRHILDDFYYNVIPTISANPKSKLIITSTPNGPNKFKEIYTNSINGENGYANMKID
jgi:hypothetical protein